MKCVHTFGTGRHKRQADITFLFQYSIIFLFTDNNNVVSQTANCDFWGVQAGCPNTVSYRKGWNLSQAGLNLVAPRMFNCDKKKAAGTPPICKRVGIFEQADPKLINE